jgi:hypothetical protein
MRFNLLKCILWLDQANMQSMDANAMRYPVYELRMFSAAA